MILTPDIRKRSEIQHNFYYLVLEMCMIDIAHTRSRKKLFANDPMSQKRRWKLRIANLDPLALASPLDLSQDIGKEQASRNAH